MRLCHFPCTSTITGLQYSHASLAGPSPSAAQQAAVAAMVEQQQQQQPAMHSMHDPQLNTPILRHPSISCNQQALLQLQQVSKELQAAIAQVLAGQVPVVLAVQDKKQLAHAHALVQWLQKHAGLLQSFDLQFTCSSSTDEARAERAVVLSQLEAALEQAAVVGSLQMQSFCLKGCAVSYAILQQLPAAHLTSLCAHLHMRSSSYIDMLEVAALSSLRCLQLDSCDTAAARDEVLAPLMHLQQLTQLHVGTVRPAQLQWIPASVQQLHVSVGRLKARQLEQLADCLKEHATIVRALTLDLNPDWGEAWQIALDALVAAFEAAAAAAAATSTAAGGTPTSASSSSWQLQELTVASLQDMQTAGRILQHLPAGTLTQLDCSIKWSNSEHINAVCMHTGLRSLHLISNSNVAHENICGQADDVLVPLTDLQQLTALSLNELRREQLQHLQLPQLQELHVSFALSIVPQRAQPLRLQQLTAVTRLSVGAAQNGLQLEDALPPNLCELSWFGWVTSSTAGVLPLLSLRRLQKLYVRCDDVSAAPGEEAQLAAQELVQLSKLASLQKLTLVMDIAAGLRAGNAASLAWQFLPLKELRLISSNIQADVLQQLSSLQGLTALSLDCDTAAFLAGTGRMEATFHELSLLLRPLTALRKFRILDLKAYARGSSFDDNAELHHCVEIAAFLQTVCQLPALESMFMRLPIVELNDAAVQQLSGLLVASLPAHAVQYAVRPDEVIIHTVGLQSYDIF
jgi:hypothetical protein